MKKSEIKSGVKNIITTTNNIRGQNRQHIETYL